MSVYLPGNGVTFYFMLVIDLRGVRELWKHATFLLANDTSIKDPSIEIHIRHE